jgi:hypothetical protein
MEMCYEVKQSRCQNLYRELEVWWVTQTARNSFICGTGTRPINLEYPIPSDRSPKNSHFAIQSKHGNVIQASCAATSYSAPVARSWTVCCLEHLCLSYRFKHAIQYHPKLEIAFLGLEVEPNSDC